MIKNMQKQLLSVLKMIKNILGVYFDFFGTLIDSRYAITNVWSQIAKKFGKEISPNDERIWKGILKQFDAYDRLKEKYDRIGEPWAIPSSEEIVSTILCLDFPVFGASVSMILNADSLGVSSPFIKPSSTSAILLDPSTSASPVRCLIPTIVSISSVNPSKDPNVPDS